MNLDDFRKRFLKIIRNIVDFLNFIEKSWKSI